MKKTYPVYLIEWGDAETNIGWEPLEDYQSQSVRTMFTVGYMVKDDGISTVMVQSLDPHNGNASGSMMIPNVTIIKRTRLSTPTPKPRSPKRTTKAKGKG